MTELGKILDEINQACPTDWTVEDWKDFALTLAAFKLRVIKRKMVREGTWK